MIIPVTQQLSGLLVFIKTALRAYPQFVGNAAGQYAWTADQVLRTVYSHKLFETQSDGVAQYPSWGKANVPALAIYVTETEATDVRGSTSGISWPVAQHVTLGLQYVFQPRAQDAASMAFTAGFAQTIWEVICNLITANMQATVSSLRQTYHIEEMGIQSCKLLPPLSEALRAIEGGMWMNYKRPPWDTGADSALVTDLASIYADYTEHGAAGADPLMQSIYTVPS